MPESTSVSNAVTEAPQLATVANTTASIVRPKNQVVIDPSNQAIAPAAPIAKAVPTQEVQPAIKAAAPQSAEVAWPDTQQTVAEVAEPTPSQPSIESAGSKKGLIIGLLLVLGLLSGVYVALLVL